MLIDHVRPMFNTALTQGSETTHVRPGHEGWHRPTENRRVKIIGLLVGGAGGAALGLIVNHATSANSFTLEQLLIWLSLGLLAANVIAIGAMLLRAGFGHARAGRLGEMRVRALQLAAANLAAPALVWTALRDDAVLEKRLATAGWEVWPDFVSLGLGLAAWRLWRRSRQHEAVSADEVLTRDPRPPVLYLRSFRDDGEIVTEGGTPAHWLLRIGRAGSDEETMSGILARLGPVIAIGKPGEPLPQLGAARLYVSHDQWQERVLDLIRQAQLVVIRIGSSQGVLWEIEQALAHVPRQRLVMAVLGDVADARTTIEHLTRLIGTSVESALPERRLPAWRTLLQGQSRRRLGSLIWFTQDDAVKITPVQREVLSIWNVRNLTSLVRVHAALERAWNEVLTKLGLTNPDSSRRSRVYAIGLAVLLGAFGAQWFYLGNRKRGWIYVAMFPLLLLPMFVSFVDAIRFILADEQEFEARWVKAS